PGMLMSERIRINDAPAAFTDEVKGTVAGLCKIHRKAAFADVASELLAKQRLDIGFVVHDKNKQAHLSAPVLPVAVMRGRTMMNSVNCPGSVATSILPPCCLTMMSCVIDRPRPVPSPAGLVVKNGLNIFSRTSGGIPVPLSRMQISTVVPRFFVVARRVGSKPGSFSSVLRLVAA